MESILGVILGFDLMECSGVITKIYLVFMNQAAQIIDIAAKIVGQFTYNILKRSHSLIEFSQFKIWEEVCVNINTPVSIRVRVASHSWVWHKVADIDE